jgi:exodeoxyribonuclease I
MSSFFWHDYETFGADTRRDRPCQFAGVRTDQDFNVIGKPLMVYCRISEDYLPHPDACLITGITPQQTLARGLSEREFAAQIHEALALPGTCGVGYNSIRFDDEITRHLLYRNFYDPYAREWRNGNSRWDLIDVVRAAYALRPEGIVWPRGDDGQSSFRLELLTQANELHHEAAHDALSDVWATIALARLIKQRQPRFFEYCLSLRHKTTVWDKLKLGSFTPLLHVSGRYPVRNHCMAIVLPLAKHPVNGNEVIVYDLSQDPQPLLELDAEQIRARLFVRNEDLPDDVARIPLKTLHVNRSPIVAGVNVLRDADVERLQIDIGICQQNSRRLQAESGLTAKLEQVFCGLAQTSETDADLMLYSGFFNHADRMLMQRIRDSDERQLCDLCPDSDDSRLSELWFRYRARNFPHSLNAEEKHRWHTFCAHRLTGADGFLSLNDYNMRIAQLKTQSDSDVVLLNRLCEWGARKTA